MTILEKKSKRKATAIRYLVDTGEYSAGYALELLENYNDKGLIIDTDYEPLAEYLEELINAEQIQEKTSSVEEIQEENEENYVE